MIHDCCNFLVYTAFWLKDDIIFEQPSAAYRYYTIVELHGLRYGW